MPQPRNPLAARIVSGGQTGADRAALDWAIGNGVAHGGWCPRGRIAEDGVLPAQYQLRESATSDYRWRTRQNVADSDATLIVNTGILDGGTLETVNFAQTLGKPHLIVQLDCGVGDEEVQQLLEWLQRVSPDALNVAGPRESKRPGIYALTFELLDCAANAGRR